MPYLPAFFIQTLRIARQAARADGRLLRNSGNTFWTGTTWSSAAAMKVFMLAPPHGPAMRKLLDWCDEASLVASSAHASHTFPVPTDSGELRLK